jgi:uncharacterized membrane protein YGL010W
MINPIFRYKAYHKNKINIAIHQVCVPLLLVSFYSTVPTYLAFAINMFYSINYLLYDIFSNKSIHAVYYLQSLFFLHFILRQLFTFQSNIYIHIASWVLQIIGHKIFEKNTPAFIDNLYDSFLFAPYFTFLETFYPLSFDEKEKYTIINNKYDSTKKSIVYFAGLFQKAQSEYKDVASNLSEYNHIYINTNFSNNDNYEDVLIKIINDLSELNIDIECVVGFSFGGSLTLQFKKNYFVKYNKEIKTILISPGGFKSNTFIEKSIIILGRFLYSLYCNDKWYMIKNYPVYQNVNILTNTDYIIVSTSDSIHNPLPIQKHTNAIILKNASHLNIIQVIIKQTILSQIIKNNYHLENVNIKPLTSFVNKLIYGGHFYPYHVSFWIMYTVYNNYMYINLYNKTELFLGFFVISTLWCFTEYMFHRFLLHNILYLHHKKHHTYPNKLSIINTPMSVVLLCTFLYICFFYKFEYYLHMFNMFIGINYLLFEITHLLSHSYKGENKIIRNAKYYHKLHHTDVKVNFSFVTPFWDYIFGTLSSQYNIGFTELLFGFIPFYSFFIHEKIDTF